MSPSSSEIVDPRVAAHGGTRQGERDNYEFPGMAELSNWRRTREHKASSYSCALCGMKASSPHAIYTHLAKIHDR